MTPLPLKKQVCCKKLSTKLRDLGVPQESLWYWTTNGYAGVNRIEPRHRVSSLGTEGVSFASTFTVAELLHQLPTQVNVRGCDYYLHMMLDEPHCYFARYIPTFEDRPHLCDFNSDDGMADPLAECYAYLIEQGVVKLTK